VSGIRFLHDCPKQNRDQSVNEHEESARIAVIKNDRHGKRKGRQTHWFSETSSLTNGDIGIMTITMAARFGSRCNRLFSWLYSCKE